MKDTDRIAALAALELTEQSRRQLEEDVGRILDMVEVLRTADLPADTEPLRHALELGQRTRPDSSSDSDIRDKVMAKAPDSLGGLFLVPKVLD